MEDIKDKKISSGKEKMKNFYDRHPEKLKEKNICEVCGGRYIYYNKNHHNNSKLHKIVKGLLDIYLKDNNNNKNNN